MGNLILIFSFITIITSIAGQQIFYVSPDNSINTSCLFQPCATLSQYLLDNNGSLPVVSNVEYHFLPGEHHLPTNMTLQYLHNFTMTGYRNSTSISAVIVEHIQILYSTNVTIKNMIFNMPVRKMLKSAQQNLVYANCICCKIINVQFLNYGFVGRNLMGKSYFNDTLITATDPSLAHFRYFYLTYESDFTFDYHGECTLVINNISMSFWDMYKDPIYNDKSGIYLLLRPLQHINELTIIILNSHFHNINRKIVMIDGGRCTTKATITITNCMFEDNGYLNTHRPYSYTMPVLINITLPNVNVTLILKNCKFYGNLMKLLSAEVLRAFHQSPLSTSCDLASKVVIMKCSLVTNKRTLLHISASGPPKCANIYIIGPIYIIENEVVGSYIIKKEVARSSSRFLINCDHVIAHVSGPVYVYKNLVSSVISTYQSHVILNGVITMKRNRVNTVMQFQESYVTFNGPLYISENVGSVILTQSCNVTFNGPIRIIMNQNCEYIMLAQYSDILLTKTILFKSNLCHQIIVIKSRQEAAYIKVMEYSNITFIQNNYTNLIAVDTNNVHYYNFYPFCLFQYVALQNTSVILPSHYTIIISDNFIYKCKFSFYHFISHCKWIHTAVFYGHNSRIINQQIIQIHQELQHLRHHTTIFFCSNITTDKIGPVYPGQILEVELCTPCSSDNNYSILYAETHNTFLPDSACKIAHQTELVNVITNNSKTVSYTIISEVNDSCELFLTVSPFLYYIYEVFEVQLFQLDLLYTTEYVIVILFSQLILIHVTLINQLSDVLLTLG